MTALSPLARKFIVLALIIVAAWFYSTTRPIFQADGILVANAPEEASLEGAVPVFEKGEHRLTALARLSGDVRLIAVKRYGMDRAAAVAPVDVGAAWGRLSDSAVLRTMDIAQSERTLIYRAYDGSLSDTEIQASVRNLHLVPADAAIDRQLKELRAGQVVSIAGHVVEITAPDGWRWRGSQAEPGRSAAGRALWLERLDVR